MRTSTLLLIAGCLLPALVSAQTRGSASGLLEDLTGSPRSQAPVQIDIAKGVAFHGRDYEILLLPAGISIAEVELAINPIALLKARADADQMEYVFASVLTESAKASASFVHDGEYGGYLGRGELLGARVENGRLAGTLRTLNSESGGMLEATLDAPVIPPAIGTPLPADGGEPWRDFERLRDAIRSGDEASILALLGSTVTRQFPRDEPFDAILPQLVKSFPFNGRFVSGAMTAVDARLVLLDDSSGKPVRCIATLFPERGKWRMHQMSFRHRDDPIDPPPPSTRFSASLPD